MPKSHGDLEKGLNANVLESSSSLLSKQGHIILPFAAILYVVLQTLVKYNTLCDNHDPFAEWISDYYICAGFAFSVSALQYVILAFHSYRTENFRNFMLHLAAATITIIAGSSSLLTYAYNFGGICQDALGIESQATQWSKWMICAPLLAYIIISGEDKESLSFADIGVIFSLFVVVLCMFVMNFKFTSHGVSVILFVISCLSVVISMTLSLKKISISQENNMKNLFLEKSVSFFTLAKESFLLKLTWGVFPFLLISYVMCKFGIIDRDALQVGYLFLSVLANMLFLNLIVYEQIHVVEKKKNREEAEMLANEVRRSFLR